MAWLSDWAGKAESLLNNIDQSAAGAIKRSETFSSTHDVAAGNESIGENDDKKDQITTSSDTSVRKNSLADRRIPKQSSSYTKLSSAKVKTQQPKDTDDALFDFLNSSDNAVTSRSSKPHRKSSSIQRSSSSASMASTSNRLVHPDGAEKEKSSTETGSSSVMEREISTPSNELFHISRSSNIDSVMPKQIVTKATNENGSHSSEELVSYPMDTASESEFEMVSNTALSSAVPSERDSGEETHDSNARSIMADLKMQNKLLQNEVTSLQREMQSLSEQNIRSKSEMERQLIDLTKRNDDLNRQCNMKNSELQAMVMQVNDLENESQSLKRNVDSLKTDKQRIIVEQTAGSDMHSQAMEQLRLRLEAAESSLNEERESSRYLKEEALNEREKWKEETVKLSEALKKGDLEKSSHQKKVEDISKENNNLHSQLMASQQELLDYKQKAMRILQSKERLITSLKGGSEADLTAHAAHSIELEDLRQERDSIKEDSIKAQSELLRLKRDIQEIEGQYQQENLILREESEEMRISLEGETRSRIEAEKDVNRYVNDIRREREEATRARAATSERLRDKEEEIQKLRGQLMMRSHSSREEMELESRLHQLTETLLQKQTIVETLATEKSSLVLQLERAEGQIGRLCQENSALSLVSQESGESPVFQSRSNATNSTTFAFTNGSSRGVVGHVRKAASAVDQFSVRLGVFLRRYPTARLFVIVYMGLLHLWVMIVLLTYSPEMHGADYRHNNVAHLPDQHQVDHGLPKAD